MQKIFYLGRIISTLFLMFKRRASQKSLTDFLLAPSGALIAIPTYYGPTSSGTHVFRSHRSSILDLRFLSHYSYIKAIMLYKGTTWQDSGILWHTLAYSGVLWHTLAYSCILWHTLTYSGILWHTLAYSGIL